MGWRRTARRTWSAWPARSPRGRTATTRSRCEPCPVTRPSRGWRNYRTSGPRVPGPSRPPPSATTTCYPTSRARTGNCAAGWAWAGLRFGRPDATPRRTAAGRGGGGGRGVEGVSGGWECVRVSAHLGPGGRGHERCRRPGSIPRGGGAVPQQARASSVRRLGGPEDGLRGPDLAEALRQPGRHVGDIGSRRRCVSDVWLTLADSPHREMRPWVPGVRRADARRLQRGALLAASSAARREGRGHALEEGWWRGAGHATSRCDHASKGGEHATRGRTKRAAPWGEGGRSEREGEGESRGGGRGGERRVVGERKGGRDRREGGGEEGGGRLLGGEVGREGPRGKGGGGGGVSGEVSRRSESGQHRFRAARRCVLRVVVQGGDA